jgi:uncharacterized protein (TIGR02145 family)
MKIKFMFFSISIIMIGLVSKAQIKGSFIDSRNGKTYKTVKIGTQTWMAENLAYKTSSGCWAYDNNQNNVITYGYLYDWETAKKVCPKGWHLPNDAEWATLTTYLGGQDIAGGKLKSTSIWKSPNTGATNSSGFTALPGGCRDYDGTFKYIGYAGNWWSSSGSSSANSWHRRLGYDVSFIGCYNYLEVDGFSVRCIKD